jgi:diazepam-binding inhibitor (GABA receptor modulating acyl-CoA-binding protein)
MADLKSKFEKAAVDVQNLSKKPDNDTLLKLYSLYKQGTTGDVEGKRPGMLDIKGRAKYDAWAKLQGTPQKKAMEDYIKLVEKLMG